MSPVERLIRACVDDERTLTCAARFIDRTRGAALERLADERVQFVDSLQTSGRTLHHRPRATGSPVGALRLWLLHGWVLAAGQNTGDVLSACRHSQSRLQDAFADALSGSWTPELLGVLTEQHDSICAAGPLLIGLQYGVATP